jgi:transcriptional regulator with XRE-family HTH domain
MARPKYKTLAACMDAEGLTQEHVAALLGVRQGHISNLLHRKRGASLAFALKVQALLGVEARSFIVPAAERAPRTASGTRS